MVTGEEAGRVFPAALRLLQSLFENGSQGEEEEEEEERRSQSIMSPTVYLQYLYASRQHLTNVYLTLP